jgi:hypothetical protein
MIRSAIILIGLCSAGSAPAQWSGVQVPITGSAGANSADTFYPWYRNGDTPTMRRQRLEQSDALRKEAARLEMADGGTLSEEHAAYIRKQVREILGQKRSYARTGSLVAER